MLFLIVIGSAVFMVANHVQQQETLIKGLNKKIEIEQESLRVLNAEWTYLNSPSRLALIATKHFGLQPVTAGQYISASAVPYRQELDKKLEQSQSEAEILAQIEPGTKTNQHTESQKNIIKNSQLSQIKSTPMQGVLPPQVGLNLPEITPVNTLQVVR